MAAYRWTDAGHSVRCVVLAAAMLQPAAAAAAQPPSASVPEIAVVEEDGVYRVIARFEVDGPAPLALAVLTDYECIPRFMPDVRTSVVRERSAGRALVEQEAVARIMFFSTRVHLLLDVREDPSGLRFVDQSGRSFARYEGAWQLAEADGRTGITYQLSAKPAFSIPPFLVTRLLRGDAREMIDRLRREIRSRVEQNDDH